MGGIEGYSPSQMQRGEGGGGGSLVPSLHASIEYKA